MRHHGTLTRWNDERGFGFIAPAGAEGDLFVHVSAFPLDGRRPQVGEVVSYVAEQGPDGRMRAVSVLRPGQGRKTARVQEKARGITVGEVVGGLFAISVIAVLAWFFYSRHLAWGNAGPVRAAARPAVMDPHFSCDGKTHCGQMRSCAEATFYLRHCPNTQMDGDGDGVPCEQQWCR